MHFSDLKLSPSILKAVAAEGYETPTPIQQEAIPHVLAGKDLIAVAQTGTGKTAAFALPIIHRLQESGSKGGAIRVLVLSPTRELATQINAGFEAYGKGAGLTSEVIFGGVGHEPQRRGLKRGMDVLVATPGRLLDLMGQGLVDYRHLEVLVLDEADRMLDMGFIHDVKRIISALPPKRQTLLFSATMPDAIVELSRRILKDPVRVAVTPPSTTVELIDQSVFFVCKDDKRSLLLDLLKDSKVTRAIVFTRTKHGANKVATTLAPHMGAAAIHGNKSQGARERALEGFKKGTLRVLVATDIAARGIDVDDVSHVIQLDLPEVPEQYVHRIGRTARAGLSGTAWAFCSPEERGLLKDIERSIRLHLPVRSDHPYTANANRAASAEVREPREPRGRPQGGQRRVPGGGGAGGTPKKRPAPRRTGGVASEAGASAGPSPSRGGNRSFRPGRR
jgi:ATP-dependent RNA helicase RhlE